MEVRLSEEYGNISECRLGAEEAGGRKVELELKWNSLDIIDTSISLKTHFLGVKIPNFKGSVLR